MIKTINCNLIDAPTEVIASQCNCFNTMGSGVALAIKNKYPEAYTEDCKTIRGDRSKLGKFSMAHLTKNIEIGMKPYFVANLYGQYNYGTGGRKTNYEAIYCALEGLKIKMLENQLKSVAFPYKMSSDRAGADWRIIEKMIEVVFENTNIEVLICKI